MDRAIMDFMRDYHILTHNVIYISTIIAGFVVISGMIRFGIAVWRRKKGIYPPAASQMEEH